MALDSESFTCHFVFLFTKRWSCYTHGCPNLPIKNKPPRKHPESGLPWWSRGEDATFPLQGLLVTSVVRELRSLVEKMSKNRFFDCLSVTFKITRDLELGGFFFFPFKILDITRTTVLLSHLPEKKLNQWVNDTLQIGWIKECLGRERWKCFADIPFQSTLRGTGQIVLLVTRRTEPTVGKEEVINFVLMSSSLQRSKGLSKVLSGNHLSSWNHTLNFTLRK